MEELKIDHTSYLPLYEQVRLRLMEKIASGAWDDGSPLPSEQKLVELFGVSRMTIRQAVSEIVRNGYLVRERGRGTFVHKQDTYHLLGGAHNFPKNAEAMGRSARTKVIGYEWLSADDAAAEYLHVPVGEKFLLIRLLRFLDDALVGRQAIYISQEIGNLVDVDVLAEMQSLNPLLQVKGKMIAESHAVQGARLADNTDCELLGCSPTDPVLYSNYTEFGPDEKIYSYSEIVFRADRFKWVFKVAGP
jgi:GntR family transcriptional regulator